MSESPKKALTSRILCQQASIYGELVLELLLISPNFHPEKTGIGVTATDSARLLTQLGHKVRVVVAMPHYPEWSIYEGYRSKLFIREQFENIDVNRVWVYMPKKVNTKGRILFEISMSFFASIKTLFAPCDVMLAMCPPLSVATSQAIIALLRRKPFWTYIQDIQPDAAICLGMLKNKYVIAASRWMERFIYNRSEKILVLSQGMKDNLLAKGIADEKIYIVPIAVDLESLNKQSSETEDSIFRATYGLEGKHLVLYTGNIGVKQNPEILVECAKRLKDHSDIFFPIVGEGALKDRVEKMISDYSLENIKVLPLCSDRNLLSDMLRSVDTLLLPQRKEVIDIVVPSKLITYMTSGTPVIASVHQTSEAAKVLDQNDAGIRTEPEEVDDLVEAILKLKENPELAQNIGARGRALVEERYEYSVVRDSCYAALFDSSNKSNQPEDKKEDKKNSSTSSIHA